MRTKTAELIATVLQNNPYCQTKFIEKPNYVQLLMTLVEREQEALIRIKALHAISCELFFLTYKISHVIFNHLITYEIKLRSCPS